MRKIMAICVLTLLTNMALAAPPAQYFINQ